jgi:MFS family permease
VIGVSGTLALLLAAAIWRLMRDDPLDRRFMTYAPPSAHAAVRRQQAGGHAPILRSVLDVFRYRNTWLLFVVNSGICGAFLAFTGLWGVPFFVQHHALSVPQAALVTSMMLVLFAAGGPLMGGLSDRWKLRKRPFAVGAGVTVAGFAVLAAWPSAPLPTLVAALAAASLGAGAMAISFGYAKESVPIPLQGTVTGVVNAGVMVGTLTQMASSSMPTGRGWRSTACASTASRPSRSH